MPRRYVTADVFTTEMFCGNPLAVVLDAEGLSTEQMQAITVEFNYSETTFVLPARDGANTAWVRIFNPSREMPFAGHPNIGTAFVLAREYHRRGETVPDRFIFEEAAGLVRIELLREGDAVTGAELTAPEPLSRGKTLSAEQAAPLFGLAADDIVTTTHLPVVASVGMPFLVMEIATRDALRRARPVASVYEAVLPGMGAFSVYGYTRDIDAGTDGDTDLQARMFMSRMVEDPATGSATGAMIALRAASLGVADLQLRVGQGTDMGRPSLLLARATREGNDVIARVGGRCVAVMDGALSM
jgi:trans-2,3-dihydro-3-hydroxyanthranilate isomerase